MCFFRQTRFSCGDWEWAECQVLCKRECPGCRWCPTRLIGETTPQPYQCKTCVAVSIKLREQEEKCQQATLLQLECKDPAFAEKLLEDITRLKAEISNYFVDNEALRKSLGRAISDVHPISCRNSAVWSFGGQSDERKQNAGSVIQQCLSVSEFAANPENQGFGRLLQNLNNLPSRPYYYTYGHLAKDEVRLLRVSKDAVTGWQYSIEHKSLRHTPAFETVSYVWGNDTREGILNLEEGITLAINSDLAEALPYLSRFCETGYLWIDQICINQSCTLERNEQVQMMGDIYESGNRVLVWLGIFASLNEHLEDMSNICEESKGPRAAQMLLSKRLLFELRMAKEPTLKQLRFIFSCPWFSRAWVFQEIVLSKKSLFLIGLSAMDLRSLYSISAAARSLTAATLYAPTFNRFDLKSIATESVTANQTNFGTSNGPMIQKFRGTETLHLMHSSWLFHHRAPGNALPFHRLLAKMSSLLAATDDRDLVYAFLSLKLDPRISIEPKYSMSYEEVLIDTASSIIRGTGSLAVFEDLCRLRILKEYHSQLHSWVPDWKVPALNPPLHSRDGNIATFKASSGRYHLWRVTTTNRELVTKGRWIDTVDCVFEPLFQYAESDWREEDIFAYIDLVTRLSAIKCFIQTRYAVSADDFDRARLLEVIIVGGLTHDLVEHGHLPCEADLQTTIAAYEGVLMRRFRADEAGLEYTPWNEEDQTIRSLRYHSYIAQNRRVFLSRYKKLGLTTRECEGDMICILHGCSTPVILRPCDGNCYVVVETCYMEDVMYGQAVAWEEEAADEFILI